MIVFAEQQAQLDALLKQAFRHLKNQCSLDGRLQGAALDAVQVPSYDLAFCAAELAAGRCRARLCGGGSRMSTHWAWKLARAFAAEVYAAIIARLAARPADFGLALDDILSAHPSHRPRADFVYARLDARVAWCTAGCTRWSPAANAA